MRHGLLLASPFVAAALTAFAFASSTSCSSSDSTVVDGDAGDGSVEDGDLGDGASGDDDGSVIVPDASVVVACSLHTSSNDPVALCLQKTILQTWKRDARIANGVAAGWSATTGVATMDAGAPVHDFHDDLGYGQAIADYHASSNCYGDTSITPDLDDDLIALAPIVVTDMTPLPAEYRGDTYFRLRRIAAGLRYANDLTHADAIDGLAETYGRALASNYFVDIGAIPATTDAGAPSGADAGDAGAASDAGDAATSDAGKNVTAADAGALAAAFEDGVVGTPTGGAATYKTADSAMAALALLDLASRHTADNASVAQVLEAAAAGTFYHLYNRAKDPSGFYYTEASTSPEATTAHDTPTDTSGTFSSDVQAEVAFAFLDAERIATANPALTFTKTLPLVMQAEALVATMNGSVPLYDAANLGYLAGITLPATLATTKTPLSNAFFLEAARDDVTAGSGSETLVTQLAPLKALLIGTSAGTGFLGLFTGQDAYVSTANADFSFAGASGEDPIYSSAATAAVLAALNHELPSDCAE